INSPDVILLDEPTTGLDPQARHVLWDRLHGLKERGVTLVLTTHYMDEAEQLCDRLVVMDKAKIVAMGTPSELIANHVGRDVVELRARPETLDLAVVSELTDRYEPLPNRVLCYTADGEQLVSDLVERGLADRGPLLRRASLEDVSRRLTGRTLTD